MTPEIQIAYIGNNCERHKLAPSHRGWIVKTHFKQPRAVSLSALPVHHDRAPLDDLLTLGDAMHLLEPVKQIGAGEIVARQG